MTDFLPALVDLLRPEVVSWRGEAVGVRLFHRRTLHDLAAVGGILRLVGPQASPREKWSLSQTERPPRPPRADQPAHPMAPQKAALVTVTGPELVVLGVK